MPKPKFDPAQVITDELIRILERGTLPWRKPWSVPGSAVPLRQTGEPYQGFNNFLLTLRTSLMGYTSPYWMTMRQANEQEARIRKGEKSSVVIYYGTSYKNTENARDKNEDETQENRQGIPFMKSSFIRGAASGSLGSGPPFAAMHPCPVCQKRAEAGTANSGPPEAIPIFAGASLDPAIRGNC